MTSTANSSKRPSLFLIVTGAIVVLLLVGIAAVVVTNVSRQQDREALAQLHEGQLAELVEVKSELPPLIDEYFAAFKKSYLADGSIEKAEQAAQPEREAFAQAEAQARSTMARGHSRHCRSSLRLGLCKRFTLGPRRRLDRQWRE